MKSSQPPYFLYLFIYVLFFYLCTVKLSFDPAEDTVDSYEWSSCFDDINILVLAKIW